MLLLFVLPLIFNHPGYLLFPLVVILLAAAAGKSLVNIKRIWGLLVILFFFSAILWALFLEGKTLIREWGRLSIYKESLLYGIGMGIRLNTMIISGMIFISCTKVEEFTWGLNRLGLPFRMSFALSLAFRLVPVFMDVLHTIVQAQKARGLDLEGGGLIKKARKYLPLIIPMIAYAIRKTDLLSQALESKGFGARKEKYYYFNFRMVTVDYCIIALLFFLNLFALCIRLSGFGTVISRL